MKISNQIQNGVASLKLAQAMKIPLSRRSEPDPVIPLFVGNVGNSHDHAWSDVPLVIHHVSILLRKAPRNRVEIRSPDITNHGLDPAFGFWLIFLALPRWNERHSVAQQIFISTLSLF